MSSVKLTRGCPKCGCPAEEIEYLNCGPIIRIRCPKCRFGMTEGVDAATGELTAVFIFSATLKDKLFLVKEKQE